MPTITALDISNIIQVFVSTPLGIVPARQFNQGLIIGPSVRIAPDRIRQYPNQAAMTADGFLATDPEFIAAGLYFGQRNIPQFVWIGRQDLTALQTAVPSPGSPGVNYAVGDLVHVNQSGSSGGVLTVTAVNVGGAVQSLTTVANAQGTGYTVGAGLTTSGGSGTGLTVDITAIGETYLQSLQACAAVSFASWYGFMCCNATDADHLALAAYSTANHFNVCYFGDTDSAAVLNGTANSIAEQLMALQQDCFMIYSSTQSGLFPQNAYAAAACMGLYCGLDTGMASSAFTLGIQSLQGVAPEQLTQTQYDNIIKVNCNISGVFGAWSGILDPGILSSGLFFDQILYRATLVNLIQTNIMDTLLSVPKVPQTDPGQQMLIAQVNAACAQMAVIGYIGTGNWEGLPVLALQTGQALPNGFFTQSESFTKQSPGDRAARKAMPILCCYIESNAIQFVQVQLYVQM